MGVWRGLNEGYHWTPSILSWKPGSIMLAVSNFNVDGNVRARNLNTPHCHVVLNACT